MITFYLFNEDGKICNELDLQDKEMQYAEIQEDYEMFRLNWETHDLQSYPVSSHSVISIGRFDKTEERWKEIGSFFQKLEQLVKKAKEDIVLEIDLQYKHRSGAPAGISFYYDMRRDFSVTIKDNTIEVRGSVMENEY